MIPNCSISRTSAALRSTREATGPTPTVHLRPESHAYGVMPKRHRSPLLACASASALHPINATAPPAAHFAILLDVLIASRSRRGTCGPSATVRTTAMRPRTDHSQELDGVDLPTQWKSGFRLAARHS